MNWERVLQLKEWSSLSSIQHQPIKGFPHGFEIGADSYVITQSYDRNFEMDQPGAPYVTMAYWAETLATFKRLVRMELEHKHAEYRATPPEQLLFQTDGTFDALRDAAKSRQANFFERGLYSRQGVFLYRALDIGRFTYCFSGTKDRADDRPFAVEVRLLGKV